MSRCVTFEEPRPSSRGGLWPRSVRGPLRSSALRETLIEVCTAAAEHTSQVLIFPAICALKRVVFIKNQETNTAVAQGKRIYKLR